MNDKSKDFFSNTAANLKKVLSFICRIIYKIRKLLIGVAAFVLLVIVMSYLQFTVKLVGDTDVEVNINGDYEDLGVRVSYYGSEIKDVLVLDNVDMTKPGDYLIEYTASKWFFTKRVYRNIHVMDLEKPLIELMGSDQIYLPVGMEFKEPGYKASDNVDGDITDRVITTGNININKPETYEFIYSVTDSSGNKREVTRKVTVTENDYLNCDVDKFWLKDIFSSVILNPQAEEIDYFDDIVMIGDCNTYFLYSYSRLIKAEQCWGKSNLNISEINNSTFKTFVDAADRTFDEAMNRFTPKYLIVSPGLGSPLFINDTELFQKEIIKFIDHMEEDYPDTVFVFSAIMPLNDGQLSKTFQKKINTYNYLLAEICYNRNIKLINFADTVRGSDGYGIKENYIYSETDVNDRGFHFEENTRIKLADYLRHIDIRGGN